MINVKKLAAAAGSLPAKRTNLEQKAQQYYDAVVAELRIGLAQATSQQLACNQIPFSTSKVRKQLGRFGPKKQYWWDWLHQNHPLVTVITVGNNKKGEKSMVYTQIDLETILTSSSAQEVFEMLYRKYIDETDIVWVPADINNLRRYIVDTQQTLAGFNAQTQDQQQYLGTLRRNLISAKGLYAVAEYTLEQSGHAVIPHIAKQSEFGRTYYRSLNLQNCHKTVRHAALGKAYEIDINSSVFAWKMSHIPYNMLDETPTAFSHTRELLKHKARVRKQLCKETFGEHSGFYEGLIKQVLTAISFGARTGSYWYIQHGKWKNGAVGDIIKSKKYRQRLLDNSWFKGFVQEQNLLDNMIKQAVIAKATSGELTQQQIDTIKGQSARWNRSRIVSWAYQQAEAQARKVLLAAVADQEVLLQVHDCVYTRYLPDINHIKYHIQQLWHHASCSVTKLSRWSNRDVLLKQNDLNHDQRISQEEHHARYYSSNDNVWQTSVDDTVTSGELRVTRQKMMEDLWKLQADELKIPKSMG
jgi:hypothetical protein